MRSRSCRTGNPVRRRRAFTLIELLVVLAIVGAVVSLTLVGLAGLREGSERRRALTTLHAVLASQRVRAMERTDPVTVRVEVVDAGEAGRGGRLTVVTSGGGLEEASRTLEAPGLGLEVDGLGPVGWAEARFDAMGRTTQRAWRFTPETGGGSTIWAIEFDPVAGTPRLVRLDG